MGTSDDRKKLGALGGLVIVFLGVGALALWSPAKGHLHVVALTLWGAIPVSVALWQFAYQRIDAHHLFVNRLRFQITNPEVQWGLVAEFDVPDRAVAFREAEQAVSALLAKGDRVLNNAPGVIVWQIKGLTLRLDASVASSPFESEQEFLRLEFPATPRAFRAWRHAISDTASAVVDAIEKRVRPSDQKFIVSVGFPGRNPYFGLFVNKVVQSAVTRFDIEYFEQGTLGDEVVRVRKDRVEMVTSSMHAARQLSLQYLALEQVGAS